jgi:hypothetical protein
MLTVTTALFRCLLKLSSAEAKHPASITKLHEVHREHTALFHCLLTDVVVNSEETWQVRSSLD